jgi:hypothetical protein
MEFAKFLNCQGELHLFDYDDRIQEWHLSSGQRGFPQYPNIRFLLQAAGLLSCTWRFQKLEARLNDTKGPYLPARLSFLPDKCANNPPVLHEIPNSPA